MKHKLLATSLLCLALGSAPVHADLLYWSANGTTVSGSPGTWDTTNARWGTDTAGPFTTVWNNAVTNDATLSASGAAFGSVVMGVNITMNGTLSMEQTPGTWPSWTINGANTMTFGLGSTLLAPTINSSSINGKYAGTITKTGAGTIIFNNSGGNVTKFILKQGISTFSANNRLGSGADRSDFLTFDGGTLRADTSAWGVAGKSISLTANGGTIAPSSSTVTMTFDKPITSTGAGRLSITSGQITLSSTGNAWTGPMTISGTSAKLILGAANVIPDSCVLTCSSTLNLANFSETISSLSGAGAVTLGSGTLTLANGRNTFSGPITGTGGLVQNSTSFETLSGANTYSGATTINSGALVFSGASTCTGVTTVNSGGTLRLATSGTAFPSSPIVLAAGGTLDVNSLSATIAALSGSGNVSNNLGQTLTVNGDLTTAGTVNFTGYQVYSCYSGALTNGGLYKSGTHAMALRGSNTFDGTVGTFLTFDNGTLSVGAGPDRLPPTTALGLNSPALFQLDANSQAVGSLNGNGSLNLGGGTLTVNDAGNSAFSGVIQNSELPGSSTALGHGLRGYYYDNIDMTNLKAVTNNAQVNFTWGPPNGYALACNGTSTGYGALVSPSDSLSGTFTVECWAYPSNTTASMSMIGSRKPNDFGFDMKFMGGKNVIHGDIGNGTAWIGLTADASFTYTSNTWYHIAYVVTPTTCTIYANGVQIGTTNYASSTPLLYDANHKLYIGQYGAGEYFNGQLGEVRIWNTARTATEIQTSMNQRLAGSEAGLVGYWRCDDGSGTTLTAVVGVNGTLAASTGWTASGPFGTTADYHSARWLGQVLTTAAGTYTFTATTGDGARLWVNGTLVIDSWVSQSATARSGTIALAANTRYDIVMESFNGAGGPSAGLLWTPPGDTTTNVIPTEYLFLPGPGALVMVGTGTLTLSGANTYSGNTIVAAGTLFAQADGALGNGNVTVSNANLTLQSGLTNGYLSPSANLLLNGTAVSGMMVTLGFSGAEDIHGLSYNGGATYQAAGTYGSSSSSATHQDDTRFSTSGSGILNVVGAPSTTVLTSSGSPSATYGSPLTLTATVTPSGVTGTATFYDGANWLGSSALNGVGVATLSVNNLQVTASPHALTAVYSGDATHAPSTSGSVSQTTTPAPLTPNVVVSNKVYDATITASISSATTFTGILSGDTNYVHISGTAVANFDTKDKGVGKTVTITSMTLSGSLASNYSMPTATATVFSDITARALTVTGLTPVSRPYDTTTSATFGGAAVLNGVLGIENVTLNTSAAVASFATKTVGTNKVVTVNGYTLNGLDAGNYSVTPPTLTANITSVSLAVVGLTANGRIYDGTTNATFSGTATLSGVIGSDVVNLVVGAPVASFNDKTAANSKPVKVIGGYTITGADAANYTVAQPAGLTANITPDATTCAVASSANPSTLAANVTFTATVSGVTPAADSPTGSVAFFIDDALVGTPAVTAAGPNTATASYSTAGLSQGAHTVKAQYGGDSNFAVSPMSSVLTQTVSVATSPVTITNIIGTTLTYGGGAGTKFILLKSATVNALMSTWTYPGLTNTATPGSFTIPAVGTGTPVFYRIQSE